MSINSIPLPNADQYGLFDSDSISIALGYTCHLVYMLSKIFCIDLHYKPIPIGSKSLIEEGRTKNNTTKFPLYARGVDAKRFNRAVFLLNKDIE